MQLHPVPGRVADDGIEATFGARALPIRPDAGEGRLPVEKAFLVDKMASLSQQFGEVRALGPFRRHLGLAQRNLDRIAEKSAEEGLQRRPAVAVLDLQPVDGMHQ